MFTSNVSVAHLLLCSFPVNLQNPAFNRFGCRLACFGASLLLARDLSGRFSRPDATNAKRQRWVVESDSDERSKGTGHNGGALGESTVDTRLLRLKSLEAAKEAAATPDSPAGKKARGTEKTTPSAPTSANVIQPKVAEPRELFMYSRVNLHRCSMRTPSM
jgi:hypothetical protein